jgi:HD-like signal output (HDOD) protein
MIIACPHCGKRYSIPEDVMQKLSQRAAFACPACKGSIQVSLTVQPGSAPSPAASAPAAAPPPAPEPDQDNAQAGDDTLKERLARALEGLPAMPHAMDQVRGLMADGKARPADMAHILEQDQTIAPTVLRLAGMSLYGDPESVRSIQQAVGTLGIKTLHEFVTLACASVLLGNELSGYGLQAGDLWKHSLAVAYCARALAAHKKPDLADEAFSAGLFHDCGKLLLDSCVAERREAFFSFVYEQKKPFPDAERQILGFDHPQVAADVCVKWRLPKRQVVAIALHHTPSRFVHNELACIIHAADATSMMSGIGSGIDGLLYTIDEKAMEFLNIDGDRIGVLMADAAGYVKRVMACF